MVTISAKEQKGCHGNANYWPSDCFFVTNKSLNIKLDILNVFVHVKTPG